MESRPKKIVLLGHVNVGKTSLVKRFVHDFFSEKYISTIGVTVERKEIQLDGKNITLIIWDIEGHASIENVPESYLIGTQGIIYVFDLSRRETCVNIKEQMDFLRTLLPFVPIKIIGNKMDLIDDNELVQIQHELSALHAIKFYATSAKTGINVEIVFNSLAKLLML